MPNLFGLRDLTAEQLTYLIGQSRSMLEVLQRPVPVVPALRGRRIGLMFFEPSTRTRMSFELAVKNLGADSLNFSAGGSSLSKGETLLDTAMTVSALGAHCIVVRDSHSGMPEFLSRHLDLPIINAGDGTNEHPTQALLDLVVMGEEWDDAFAGKTLSIVGDISRSRVARSNLWAARTLGMTVRLVAPRTFVDPGLEDCFGVPVFTDLEQGIRDADAVMALRVQKERRQAGGPYIPETLDYFLRYGLTRKKLDDLAPNAVLLHPGPVNRAVELAPDLLYNPDRSRIQRQVTAGVAVRMAVLYWALGASDE